MKRLIIFIITFAGMSCVDQNDAEITGIKFTQIDPVTKISIQASTNPSQANFSDKKDQINCSELDFDVTDESTYPYDIDLKQYQHYL